MNKQREIIYDQRRRILEGKDLRELFFEMLDDVVSDALELYGGKEISSGDWDYEGFAGWMHTKFNLRVDKDTLVSANAKEALKENLSEMLQEKYRRKEQKADTGMLRYLEKVIMLQVFDSKWKDHLYAMDYLREGIHLRAYGQREPLVEYTNEGFSLFTEMVNAIKIEIAEVLFRIEPQPVQEERGVFTRLAQNFIHSEFGQFEAEGAPVKAMEPSAPLDAGNHPAPEHHVGPKIGRNDPCPCGSGKKYKKCCGK